MKHSVILWVLLRSCSDFWSTWNV